MEGEMEQIQSAVEEVLRKFDTDIEQLLPILQAVQGKLGYLPAVAMKMVAAAVEIPEVYVYSVGTFYNQFRLNPPGKHQIKVCMGTACHMTGGDIIMDSFERRLEIEEGETTEDREFSLERVACVGCCALAPVVLVNEEVEAKVRPTRVDGILLGLGKELTLTKGKKQEEGEPGEC
ncbi:NADH-quinone oxidoreductase subunit NuoE [Phosphitispora sp. TUW77]|uniref:NADH-quinone oxidoreductase subunit NuoE n=1 Tax=Phosphitispora sp. TUW77 TaxID=3152361 RepID=UPI003AB754E0